MDDRGGTNQPPAVRLHQITKEYPGVLANDRIDLEIQRGSIHGLLGENGAGKSTLVKILYGLTFPSSGWVEILEQKVRIDSARTALSLGIGMVQQHFSLVHVFSVTENLVLGCEPKTRQVFLDFDRAVSEIQGLSDRYGFGLNPRQRVEELPIGAQQKVEILKALYRGAEILILDEPTAALAPQEVGELIVLLHRLKDQGKTVIFISHKLQEVIDLCDRVTVLRAGKVVAQREISAGERVYGDRRTRLTSELAQLMIGHELAQTSRPSGTPADALALRLDTVSVGDRLGPVDLTVREGEILGVAGVEGNGQLELVETVVGVRRCSTGSIWFGDQDVTRFSVRKRLSIGLAHIAEDRHFAAVAPQLDLAHNAILGFQDREPFSRFGVRLSQFQMRRFAQGIVNRFKVIATSVHDRFVSLSGGNQQKFVVGRELSRDPKLIVAAQPTRGLDVAAAAYVHEELGRLRQQGAAVLLVSLELTEILELADRLVVLSGGKIAGEARPGEIDVKTLGRWMTGEESQRIGTQ